MELESPRLDFHARNFIRNFAWVWVRTRKIRGRGSHEEEGALPPGFGFDLGSHEEEGALSPPGFGFT
nr:hypothetical protein CFP56_31146 [Quercus suber]